MEYYVIYTKVKPDSWDQKLIPIWSITWTTWNLIIWVLFVS